MKIVYLGEDSWVEDLIDERGWSRVSNDTLDVQGTVLDLRERDRASANEEIQACLEAHRQSPLVVLVSALDLETAARCARLGARIVCGSLLEARGREAAIVLSSAILHEVRSRHVDPSDVEKQNFKLQILQGLGQAVSTSLQVSTVCTQAVTVLSGWLPQAAIALYLGRPGKGGAMSSVKQDPPERWVLEALNNNSQGIGFPEELPQSIANQVSQTRPGEILQEGQNLAPGSTLEFAVIAVHGSGGPLGVLVFGREESVPSPHVDDKMLRAVATQLGKALENALLFEEIGEAYKSLKSAQAQLVHAEKFAAVGLLAAELAHEVNNPAAFVITNLSVMQEYVETIGLFHNALAERLESGPIDARVYSDLLIEHEIEFLDEDLGALVRRSLIGLERIHQVVMDLRFFSRDERAGRTKVNVESVLEACISLIRHQAKYRAEIELDFQSVPPVMSDASRLSQVFLNLLVNAVQAIEAKEETQVNNWIRVSTRFEEAQITVLVSDSGGGLSPEARKHLFEPFFTTKAPGQGTGLGLSISRDILRELGGDLRVVDIVGHPGATFAVTLPVEFDDD